MRCFLALVAALSTSACAGPRAVEFIAHRGASHDAPENSIAAFRLGWEQADANELDVHLSRDGRLAVIHDASTKRTAGVDKPVLEQSMLELKVLGIPALEDVLDLLPAGRRLFIEIKCGPEALPELARVLGGAGAKAEQAAIIGFNRETMVRAKKAFPAMPVYWLVSYKPDPKSERRPELHDLIMKACEGGLDGLNLEAAFPIDAAFVRKVRSAGLKLYTWTVDDPEIARRHVAAEVDGITTNRPGRLRAELNR